MPKKHRKNAILSGLVKVQKNKDEGQKFTVARLRCLHSVLLFEVNSDLDDESRREGNKKSNSVTTSVNCSDRKVHNFRGTATQSVEKNYVPNSKNNRSAVKLNALNSYKHKHSSRLSRYGISERSASDAWRVLSCFPSPDKEGRKGISSKNAFAQRGEMESKALSEVRRIESRVVEIIRSVGEIVVFCEQNIHLEQSQYVFEYFCDANLLALLVDIVMSKPISIQSLILSPYTIQQRQENHQSMFHEVSYTAQVKAQILQTASILVSNVQNSTSLYYMLSNNYINNLVFSMIPLCQFTDEALEEMMPIYISFLKTLALQLAVSPHLFDFYVVTPSSNIQSNSTSRTSPHFPLFSAAVEVATSSYAQSDPFVHLTALNIILNISQNPSKQVTDAISDAVTEQCQLFTYLCRKLIKRYHSLVNAVILSSSSKKKDILSRGIAELQDQFHFWNDLIRCGVKNLNVRFCETVLQKVIYNTLLESLIIENVDGNDDLESEIESSKAVSMFVLAQLFLTMEYSPILRMIAVSLLHPMSPIKTNTRSNNNNDSEEYVCTTTLNSIVQMDYTVIEESRCKKDDPLFNKFKDSNDNAKQGKIKVKLNPYRQSFINMLSGKSGDPCATAAIILFQSILDHKVIDLNTLKILEIMPIFDESEDDYDEDFFVSTTTTTTTLTTPSMLGNGIELSERHQEMVNSTENEKYTSFSENISCSDEKSANSITNSGSGPVPLRYISPFENALGGFLVLRHETNYDTSTFAMECGGSLVLSFLSKCFISILALDDNNCPQDENKEAKTKQAKNRFYHWKDTSPLLCALAQSTDYHAVNAMLLWESASVSELFIDLVEMEIARRYAPGYYDDDGRRSNASTYFWRQPKLCCNIDDYGPSALKNSPDVLLIDKSILQDKNDVEDARFAIRMTLHLKALRNIISDSLERVVVVIDNQLRHQEAIENIEEENVLSSWKNSLRCRTVDIADESVLSIGNMKERAAIGTELDLRGRTIFFFHPPKQDNSGSIQGNMSPQSKDRLGRKRMHGDIQQLKREASGKELILVVDPTAIFVVIPTLAMNETDVAVANRGKVVSSTPLQGVIASAKDGEWLHIAVRNAEDIGIVIKNGE